ncbi:MAG TPA: EamA family transporter [Patescibacteria group bacterium]|nr:EamA family transporter [Patescibacteria group bacterium]
MRPGNARWRYQAYLLVVIAATLWGGIAVFVKQLKEFGFDPLQIVAIRSSSSAFLLLLGALVYDRSQLLIRWQDGKYFIGTGIVSIVFFNWCYFTSMAAASVSVAAILLYTAPAFVLLLSRVFFKEALTLTKLMALVLTFTGCGLVTGFLPTLQGRISFYGLLTGLGAGVGYALYSIFGKFALRKYSPLTVTIYTFAFATLALLPVSGLWERREFFLSAQLVAWSLAFGFFPTVLSFLCYTAALSRIEPGQASIIATLEPIVAVIIGVVVFGEILDVWQIGGIVLVVVAVLMVQRTK